MTSVDITDEQRLSIIKSLFPRSRVEFAFSATVEPDWLLLEETSERREWTGNFRLHFSEGKFCGFYFNYEVFADSKKLESRIVAVVINQNGAIEKVVRQTLHYDPPGEVYEIEAKCMYPAADQAKAKLSAATTDLLLLRLREACMELRKDKHRMPFSY